MKELQLVVPRYYKNVPSRMCHRFKEVRAATHEIVTYNYSYEVVDPRVRRSVYDRMHADNIVKPPTTTVVTQLLKKMAIIVEKGEIVPHSQCGHIMNSTFYREIEEHEIGKKCKRCFKGEIEAKS
jgi:hypothetical protein